MIGCQIVFERSIRLNQFDWILQVVLGKAYIGLAGWTIESWAIVETVSIDYPFIEELSVNFFIFEKLSIQLLICWGIVR